MKLGTSSPLWHSDAKNWAERHAKLGLEAINFHLTSMDARNLVDEYVHEAQSKGLTIAEVGVWRNTLDPDEKARQNAIDYAAMQLRLADEIGARCCVNILGARGARWDGAYKENFTKETWQLGMKTIREIIDRAEPKHSYYTIEPMPWMFPTGPNEYLHLLEDVDREHFAVHMDVFNWMTSPQRYFCNEEFVCECFEKLGRYVKSCHLKDVRLENNYTLCLKETYPGNGGINIRHLIETALRYDADMSFIIEHLDTDEAYLKSVAYIRTLMNETPSKCC